MQSCWIRIPRSVGLPVCLTRLDRRLFAPARPGLRIESTDNAVGGPKGFMIERSRQDKARAGVGKGGICAAALLLCLLAAPHLWGYSVLSHEALIDAAWDGSIVPLLRSRYPNASDSEINQARAYAYGGCVIQDLGYYPFGNHFFSNLTHYVRSGEFVEALLKDSQDVNEYAFALGALSHYVADDTGHPLAVNLSVPQLFPRLRDEYGNRVTYEDNPTAHIMTEFSFDVVQITGAGYLPRTYHNFVGFNVPESLLNRAFADTYGLDLSSLFWFEGLSLRVYKTSASEIVPDLGQVLWRQKRKKLDRIDPQIVTVRFSHRLSTQNYQRPGGTKSRRFRPWTWRWRATAQRANLQVFSKVMVFFIEVVPKVGPLQTLRFRPPTVPVQELFIKGFDVTVARYESDLEKLRNQDGPLLPDTNLDTGNPLQAGQYRMADDAYARLLNDLAKRHFRDLSPELRQNILAFYGNLDAPIATKSDPKQWRKTLRELAALKSAPVQTELASE